MPKRFFFSLISAVLLLTSSVLPAFAEEGSQSAGSSGAGITFDEAELIAPIEPDVIVPPDSGQFPFSGQNQYYSVVFRGNGEAIVTLRVALTNTNEDGSELTETTLRIPKVQPTDLSVYQITAQGPCVRYEPRPLSGSEIYTPPSCLEYGEPDYYNYYYSGGKYQKAKFDYSGDTLDITLPKPIPAQKSGSFFVYFRAMGYASKNIFGAFRYEFESMKTDEAINSMTIGISTDADQVLKGTKGEVDYRFDEASTIMKAAPSSDAGAVANTAIDRFVSQIGQGSIVKTASNLAALESYKVTGMYAPTRFKLYARELSWLFVAILLLGVMAYFVVRLFRRRFGKTGEKKTDSKSSDAEMANNFLTSLGISFAAALLSSGYTILVFVVGSSLGRLVDYQYQAVVVILLVVISFAMYLLFIVGPAVYTGFKKGPGWGIGTFVMTTLWLILIGVIAVFILFAFTNSPYPYPVPLMESMGTYKAN